MEVAERFFEICRTKCGETAEERKAKGCPVFKKSFVLCRFQREQLGSSLLKFRGKVE